MNLAKLQDQEVGDGTTSVVIVAAELLKKASVLIEHDIHPQSIIAGYALAAREAARYVQQHLALPVQELGEEALVNLAKTTLASKILGADSDLFAPMCVQAVQRVKHPSENKYHVESINILKLQGAGARESELVKGYALNCTRASPAMPLVVKDARIACVDFSLRRDKLAMGYQVVVTDTEQLEKIRARESDIVKEKIELILASGANVLLTTKGIDDLALKYFVERGCMAVRRVTKDDLKRIARATGATVLVSMADTSNEQGGQEFNSAYLGRAESVSQERLADEELIFVRGAAVSTTASIIFRGPNSAMLDEMQRAMNDALHAVAKTLESGQVVAGGGAVEAALNIYLENFATTMGERRDCGKGGGVGGEGGGGCALFVDPHAPTGSRQQLAVAEYAAALLVIPRVLAVNGAFDAVELVAKLRAYHHKAQTDATQRELRHTGLDLVRGQAVNNIKAGVLEPAVNKLRCLQFATEAAITILRIDDVFKLNQKVDPKNADPHGHGH